MPAGDGYMLDVYLMDRKIGSTAYRFSVAPALSVSAGGHEQTIAILERGLFNFPRGGEPLQLTLKGALPGNDHRGGVYRIDWEDPTTVIQRWQSWMPSRDSDPTILHFMAPGTPLTLDCTISKLTWDHDKGSGWGDITFQLTLKEYADVLLYTVAEIQAMSAQAAQANEDTGTPADPGNPPDVPDRADDPPPGDYVVKEGDSLFTIAQLLYGDGTRWPDIYNANVDTIGANPDLIQPGMDLVIPGGDGTEDQS